MSEMRILLTATVTPHQPGLVTIADPTRRRAQYVDSLARWSAWTSARGLLLTLAENSGEDLERLATDALGRVPGHVELLAVPAPGSGDIERGIGAAESMMLDAFARSHAGADELWVKCTGRLFVRNLDQLLPVLPDKGVICARLSIDLLDVDTRLFVISSGVWRKHFYAMAKQVDRADGRWLERVMARRLLTAIGSGDADLFRMRAQPHIVGYSGTRGERYDGPVNDVKRCAWELFARRALAGALKTKHY